jgi:hypothetical protein
MLLTVILYVSVPPAATGSGLSTFMTAMSALALIVVLTTLQASLLPFGSLAYVTAAEFARIVPAATLDATLT